MAVVLTVGAAKFVGGYLGGSLGDKLADWLVPEKLTITGEISTASLDVFVNSKSTGAARASADIPFDVAVCSKDSPTVFLAEGSEIVFVNGCVASRKTEKTTCGAQIAEGSPNVFIGGPTARVREVADEVPFLLRAAVFLIELRNLKNAVKCLRNAWKAKASLPCLLATAGNAGWSAYGLASQTFGNPVHAATGIKFLFEDADISLPGALPFVWSRFYGSHDRRTSTSLGMGWSTGFEIQLQIRPREGLVREIVFIDETARETRFQDLDAGTAVYNPVEGLWLCKTEGGRYLLQKLGGYFYLFEEEATGEVAVQSLWLERIEDGNANFQHFSRDDDGRLQTIADNTGRLVALDYEGFSQRVRQIRLATGAPGETPGVLVSYDYTDRGQLAQIRNRQGEVVRHFAYEESGLLCMHADAAGLECHYEWQAFADRPRVTRHWTNDGETYEVQYELPSRPGASGNTVVTDQLGRVSEWKWNADYETECYTDPLRSRWRFEYNDLHLCSRVTLPEGQTEECTYDTLGMPSVVTDTLGRREVTLWTELGAPWQITDASGAATVFTYDERGNTTSITEPDGHTTTYVYDKRGLPLQIEDAKGGIKRLRWDERALLTSYTDCSGRTTTYEYDGWGNRQSQRDAAGNVTREIHDALGQLRSVSQPDGAHWSYDYDGAGRLVTINDPLSRSTRYHYNRRSQLLDRVDAENRQVALAYDAALRLSQLVNENGESFAFEYDDADRLVQEHRVGGQRVTVEYDRNGWPTAVTHHAGIGDDVHSGSAKTVQGQTPEIAGWGDHPESIDSGSSKHARRTELLRDDAGRLVQKRTASHHYHYQYDALDQLTRASKLKVSAASSAAGDAPELVLLHINQFVYDNVGNLIAETATDHASGQSHTLRHSHDPLGNRTQTELPDIATRDGVRALNYLYYGSGHLHQINLSQRSKTAPDAQAVHQLICDIERDELHQETLRTQGRAHTRYTYDPVGRMTGAWSRSGTLTTQPFGPRDPGAKAWQETLDSLTQPASSAASRGGLQGLVKAWRYDKAGELRASRHSLQGDTAHQYDATGRILQTQHGALQGVRNALPQAANESFGYDPAGNIQDSATQQAVQRSTALSQRGYVRDNLVRVFEDKRYFYDGHARLIRKLSGKHTDQSFVWDEENNLVEVTTTRRPGTENATTQTTRFDYDAIGRRVAKHDSFGKTVFIWEGMRLIEERRGSAIISYVYEPDSYVPLARLDADGESTEWGGLGTTDDPALGEIETGNRSTTDTPSGLQPPAANDSLEAQYWQALSPSPNAARKTGTDDYARLCNVYYFHTDQVGMPQELANAQGQVIWQASYKTWGSTVSEEWEARTLGGDAVHPLDEGDSPSTPDEKQQNLRFQGQYLDRETGLHYNTFRYYDADIGRFVCPDPIGLAGGSNLGSYSPNPISWIDPWAFTCSITPGKNFKDHFIRHKGILEKLLGKKYPKWKDGEGIDMLKDIEKMKQEGRLVHVGQGTLKKDQPPMEIYRGDGVTYVGKKLPNGNEEFVTILESGKGMDNGIIFLP
ncbi:RHS repeat-associated core domain-containing protein [Diaphorobacter caeni]|uniref:RHS repeat-associated core domain-containing protein n=1 Tax=Diaphorobacter caeni TaxID=2784387 RepID=UPI00188F6624|nr:RHS repeat-associated core domain-containing protein [Diaphorobacter caeni]MBF5006797.1 PAAR/RHS domain-containing protein [Diaphorobacter caeni]